MKFGKWKKLKNIEDKTHRFHIVLLWEEEYVEKLAQLTLKVIFYEILTFILTFIFNITFACTCNRYV